MVNTEENRNACIGVFPGLANDFSFRVEKDEDPDYNCFAWAAVYSNVFWTPYPPGGKPGIGFDGVYYNWPFEVAKDAHINTLIEIYTKCGYEVCADGELEEDHRKIVIYCKGDDAQHAARQICFGKHRGKWTSKLGYSFQILHGPDSLEGDEYGTIRQYMKMKVR